MDKKVLSRLDELVNKYLEMQDKMLSPDIVNDHKKLLEITKAQSLIEPVVHKYEEYKKYSTEYNELKKESYGDDPEMEEMAKEEMSSLEENLLKISEELKVMLLPKDPNDERNVIIEIRSGAGGEEAAIFAADLYRMYQKYAEKLKWKHELMNFNEASAGGVKEVSFIVKGHYAYSKLKFESGVHRVQRVPKTESAGRIHTSTATVAVLPDVDDVEVNIEAKDLKIDVYRSSGAGGQSVNTTDSAVRITHLPTGIIVTCQDERSQIKNKAKAMKFLKVKIYDVEQKKQKSEIDSQRKGQVGSGDRSEKIRTYNFPQGRVTDHRIGLTLHKLDTIMEGDIEEMINSLVSYDQAEKLKQG